MCSGPCSYFSTTMVKVILDKICREKSVIVLLSVDGRNYLPPNVGQVYGIHGVSPVDCYEGSGPFNTNFTSCRTEGRCVKLTVVTLGSVLVSQQLKHLQLNFRAIARRSRKLLGKDGTFIFTFNQPSYHIPTTP